MTRPWGWMVTLISRPTWWLKLLRVSERTSLQYHHNRDEYFIGVFRVPRGDKHRLQHGFFIELATGSPDEDDIVRLDDDYGRI